MSAAIKHEPWGFLMRLRYSRVGVWVMRPFKCKLGLHQWDEHHWGFGGAEIDWFCKKCEHYIGSTALDDARPEDFERIAAAQRILGDLNS